MLHTEEEIDAFWLEQGLERQPNGQFIQVPRRSAAEAKAAAAGRATASGTTASEAATSKTATVSRATGDSRRTRERIRAAAEALFQERAYESVGVRQIAAEAKVDQALLHRYFGSKEKLFAEIISVAFVIEDVLDEEDAALAEMLVSSAAAAPEGFDAFRLLVRACGSPSTIAAVATAFHEQFVRPLATMLKGPNAELRASLIASHVLGLYVAKHALRLPVFTERVERSAVAHVAAAVRACLTPPPEGTADLDFAPGPQGEVDEGVGLLFAEAVVDEGEHLVEERLEEGQHVEALEAFDG
jgi:AcrR family transcriptional regulator